MRHFALGATLGAFAACMLGPAALAQANACYSYDALGRVLSASYGNGMTVSYGYDLAGNRSLHTTSMVSDNFTGGPGSDILMENTGGSVDIGAWTGTSLTFTQVSGLGAEWAFKGDGNFLGDGQAEFLLENTSGAVVVGQVVQTKPSGTVVTTTNYTQIAQLGPEWKFVGVGNFLGHCQTDFLMESTSGSTQGDVVVGEVLNGQATLTTVSQIGTEWTFLGTGYFLGDGKPQWVMVNTAHAIVTGEVTNNQASYIQIGVLATGYTFEGSGNYFGGSTTDLLLYNAATGAVQVANVASGQLSYTSVTGLGSGWSFRGSGDFLGVGHDQFLIENTSGVVDAADCISKTSCVFTALTALGSEWTFHE